MDKNKEIEAAATTHVRWVIPFQRTVQGYEIHGEFVYRPNWAGPSFMRHIWVKETVTPNLFSVIVRHLDHGWALGDVIDEYKEGGCIYSVMESVQKSMNDQAIKFLNH